jgi:hypothetical protein
VSSSSRTPTPGGSSTGVAPGADGALDGTGDCGPQDSSAEVARSGRTPIPDTITMVGTVASEAVADDESSAPEVGVATSSMAGDAAVVSHATPTDPSAGSSSLQP